MHEGLVDQMPVRFLKETANKSAPMYCHLYQQSYNFGELLSMWLSATICPVYKKGANDLPSNYRHVSLTAIPCKLLEHISCTNFWRHLNNQNIITNKQHGFRGGMSCKTQ